MTAIRAKKGGPGRKSGPNPARQKFKFFWALMADPELSASAKNVAAALLLQFHNNRTGQCNPSMAAIAKVIGRDRRNVFPAISDLIDSGWMTSDSTKGGSASNTNRFKFDLNQLLPVMPTSPLTGDEDIIPTGDVDATSDENCTRGDVDVTRTIKNHSSLRDEGVGVQSSAPAPDGAALEEKFEQLRQNWPKPDRDNPSMALKAFTPLYDHGDRIILSAQRWASVVPPRYLPKLETWLRNGAWQDDPIDRTGRGNAPTKKPNPVDAMLNAGGLRRDNL